MFDSLYCLLTSGQGLQGMNDSTRTEMLGWLLLFYDLSLINEAGDSCDKAIVLYCQWFTAGNPCVRKEWNFT